VEVSCDDEPDPRDYVPERPHEHDAPARPDPERWTDLQEIRARLRERHEAAQQRSLPANPSVATAAQPAPVPASPASLWDRLRAGTETVIDAVVSGIGCTLGCNEAWAPNTHTQTQPRNSFGLEVQNYTLAAITPFAGRALGKLLGNRVAREAASALGFDKRIPPQRAPFNSHGQSVFFDGKRYITPDVDGHSGGAWKLFDRRGNRIGTYDEKLNRIGD
jgi:hypothetical protein